MGIVTSSSSKNNAAGIRSQVAAAVAANAAATPATASANGTKSLPSSTGNATSGGIAKTNNKKSNPAPQAPSNAAPLPPLRQKTVVIKEKIPPPVPPRGSPRSTGGSSGNISHRAHSNSHSSVRSSKDSLKDAGWKRRGGGTGRGLSREDKLPCGNKEIYV